MFNFSIAYNQGLHPLYNGNIAETKWRSANQDKSLRSYDYEYDALNRLTTATDNLNHYTLSELIYDKNGNIGKLYRRGNDASSPTSPNYNEIDKLTYQYDDGNKLLAVTDRAPTSHANEGFKDGNKSDIDYTYDANGNMTRDLNKDITNITYNHLNLPTRVHFGASSSSSKDIYYTYDATGTKIEKKVQNGGYYQDITLYAGNMIYSGNTHPSDGYMNLQFFNTPEGYVEPKNPENLGEGYNYVYQYKDHLGNVRLTYADSNKDGTIDASTEIIEENNYYPFGMLHRGYNNVVTSTNPAQDYKYNGKELNDELGLDWYDYGWRNYDAALGRWMNVDNLAEDYYDFSPYTYVSNSPMVFIDPDGQRIVFGFKKDKEGNRQGEQAVKDNINSGLGGGGFAQIDSDGNLTINITDEQKTNLSEGQAAFLGVLEEGINAVDSEGNSVDVNIGVSVGSESVVIGSFSAEEIDIQDINALGNGEALNQNSALGHEVKEQFEKQVNGQQRPEAHQAGIDAEKAITGFTRGNDTRTNESRETVTRRGRSGRGRVTYTTRSYDGSIRFTRGNRTVDEKIKVRRGNVVPRN